MFEAHHPECHTQNKSIREFVRGLSDAIWNKSGRYSHNELDGMIGDAFDTALEAIAVEVEESLEDYPNEAEDIATIIRSHKSQV